MNDKQCYFCTNNLKSVDYKEAETLKRFLNPHARMMGKNRTGLCASHSRRMAEAVKRARFLALIPYVAR
ncbi:MAG: 30S ribosomal protein S18 [Patescibacteria group bacterium]|mgnify:CR=1